MNRVIIKGNFNEPILIDADSVVAIKRNFLVSIYDQNGEISGYGCDVHLLGGTVVEVEVSFEDLIAKFFGADLVDDDDSYIIPELNLNIKAES